MVHVNTQNCRYTSEDLKERANLAFAALNAIGRNYKFVYRLMSPKPTVAAISEYLTEFHEEHPHIYVGAYAIGGLEEGIFYGQYPAKPEGIHTVVYGGWSFQCKNTENGTLFTIGKSNRSIYGISFVAV